MKLDTKALAYSLHPTVMPSVFLFFSSSSGSAGVYTSCSTVIIEQEKSSALPLSLFSSVYIESPSFLIAARHSLYRSNFLRKSSSSGSFSLSLPLILDSRLRLTFFNLSILLRRRSPARFLKMADGLPPPPWQLGQKNWRHPYQASRGRGTGGEKTCERRVAQRKARLPHSIENDSSLSATSARPLALSLFVRISRCAGPIL
mmetsp:Transcript_3216/g.11197  ORF Transcript_3216/g.11197 Transcript_3216/m.11197 type:complete len:202 (-) Transcript_3216:1036-1641(-)